MSRCQLGHASFKKAWDAAKSDLSHAPTADFQMVIQYIVPKQLDRLMGSLLKHYTEMTTRKDNEAVIHICANGRPNVTLLS